MKNMINELWHGNICPQTDSRNNSPKMKELMEYMARHHEDLAKTFTDEQKEIFEKFHVAKSETIEYRFGRVKPPKARSWQSRARAGDRQRLCDGGERLGRVCKPRRSSRLRIRLPSRSEAHNGDTDGHGMEMNYSIHKRAASAVLLRYTQKNSKKIFPLR